jgi:hypothetical protein
MRLMFWTAHSYAFILVQLRQSKWYVVFLVVVLRLPDLPVRRAVRCGPPVPCTEAFKVGPT